MFAAHAVRLLAGSTKERTTDDMATWARQSIALGERLPEITDVALDMHTLKGQQMGRDYRHFLTEASKVIPENPEKDQTYRNWILNALDDGKLS